MNTSRRRTTLGLGTLIVGAGLIGSSGAFDTVEADREVTVEFASDSNAVLTMRPGRADDDEDFVRVEENAAGELTIEILRINRNARTRVDNIVEFTNNGTQPIESISASITDNSENASLEVHSNLEGVPLEVGESVVGLGFTINTLRSEGYTGEPTINGIVRISALAEGE